MVLGLAQRVVGDWHLAEDVFQASFLLLARKASTIRRPDALSAWLHEVAFRLALRAKKGRLRRQEREANATAATPADPFDELTGRELLAILDEELCKLPETYRLPMILCGLEGLSQEEAARRLGCPAGAVKGRLERGRVRLRRNLQNRGLSLPGVLAGPLLAAGMASVSPALADTTCKAALNGCSGSPAALALADAAIKAFLFARMKWAVTLVIVMGTLGIGARWLALATSAPGDKSKIQAERPAGARSPATTSGQRLDPYGDSLPAGAVLRLGTLQQRAAGAKLALSPDGKTIIGVRGGSYVSSWDVQTGKLLRKWVIPAQTDMAELSADGRLLAVPAPTFAGIQVWEVATGKLALTIPIKGAQFLHLGGFSQDGKRFTATVDAKKSSRNSICVWELEPVRKVFNMELAQGDSSSMPFFSPDGKRLLVWLISANLCCLDIASGKRLWQTKGYFPNSIVFTPDGKILFTSPTEPALDAATGLPVRLEKPPPVSIEQKLAVSPDGRTLLIAGKDIVVWDLENGKKLRTLTEPGPVALFTPDSKAVITNKGVLQRWELATGKAVYPDNFHQGHVAEVAKLVFSTDGKRLASASWDGSVRVWDTVTGLAKHVWRHPVPEQQILVRSNSPGDHGLDLSPDGRWVAAADTNETVRVWDAVLGKEVCSIPLRGNAGMVPFDHQVLHLHVAPGGDKVMALYGPPPGFRGTGNGMVLENNFTMATWSLPTGALLKSYSTPETDFRLSALSRDGTTLISKGQVIEASTGHKRCRLQGFVGDEARGLVISPDGALAAGHVIKMPRAKGATITNSGIHVWEIATGKEVARIRTKRLLGPLVFHPDNRMLAVDDEEGVRLFNVNTGRVVFSRQMPEKILAQATSGYGYASSMAFSPDGGRLATGLPDGTILLWELALAHAPVEPLGVKEVESLWGDLRSPSAATAWRAVWRLSDSPKDALAILSQQLKVVQPISAMVTDPLLTKLESDSFRLRETAAKRLKELGVLAEPALQQRLVSSSSLEMRRRIETLLNALTEPLSQEILQQLRGVRVLARIQLPETDRMLVKLAAGVPSAHVTKAAQAALRFHGR
jgi:RNA polymerase sigma factor (sigma-70 family)